MVFVPHSSYRFLYMAILDRGVYAYMYVWWCMCVCVCEHRSPHLLRVVRCCWAAVFFNFACRSLLLFLRPTGLSSSSPSDTSLPPELASPPNVDHVKMSRISFKWLGLSAMLVRSNKKARLSVVICASLPYLLECTLRHQNRYWVILCQLSPWQLVEYLLQMSQKLCVYLARYAHPVSFQIMHTSPRGRQKEAASLRIVSVLSLLYLTSHWLSLLHMTSVRSSVSHPSRPL